MFAARLAAAVAAIAVRQASAHGKLTVPASRNEIAGGGCAHCLNGGGPCGNRASLDAFFGPQAEWTAGAIVPITIVITAHHRGHYEFRVCDQVLNSSVADANGCLNRWVLERATPEEASAAAGLSACSPGDERPHCVPFDPKHPERWYLPPATEIASTTTLYFKVPAALQCSTCTLQWHWWSANSCEPAGDYGCYKEILQDNGYWVNGRAAWWTAFAGACRGPAGPNGHSGCGEQFWNCADISVRAGTGAGPAPTPPSPTPPSPTPPPPTTRPPMPTTRMPTPTMPSTTAAPTSGPGGPMACGGCDARWSSACVWTNGRCYPIAEDMCGRYQGTICSRGGGSPGTTRMPTPRPTPSLTPYPRPTAAPTQGPVGNSCPGEPCSQRNMCRSKWGHCGSGRAWCNSESTWRAEGCGTSLIAEEGIKEHSFMSA